MPLFLFLRELKVVLHATRTRDEQIRSPTAGQTSEKRVVAVVVISVCLHFSPSLSLSLSPSDNSSLTRTAEASTIPSSAGKRTRLEPAAGSEGAKKRAGRGRKMRGRVFFCSGDGDGDGDIGVVETKLSKITIAAR